MKLRRYNAWRFRYPYVKAPADEPDEIFEVADASTGLGISPTGGVDMVDEQASVRQSILLLLSTIPG